MFGKPHTSIKLQLNPDTSDTLHNSSMRRLLVWLTALVTVAVMLFGLTLSQDSA